MNANIFIRIFLFLSMISCVNQSFSAIVLIAKNGQPAAGFSPDFIYAGITAPSIGPSGHVVFYGVATNSVQQVNTTWTGLPGQLKVMIREDELPIGLPEEVLSLRRLSGRQAVVTKSGNVGFFAAMKNTNDSISNGLFAYVNGEIHEVLTVGEQAPGFPQGHDIFSIYNFAFTDAGMAIYASVNEQDNSRTKLVGVWFWNYETLELIPPPIADCVFKVEVRSFDLTPISTNEFGEVVFPSSLDGSLCPLKTSGVFKWRDGKTEMILADGDLVPDMENTEFSLPLELLFVGIGTENFKSPIELLTLGISDQSEIIFSVNLQDSTNITLLKQSVWVADSSGSLKLLMLGGELLFDDEDISLLLSDSFIEPLINNGISMVKPKLTSAVDGSLIRVHSRS